MNKRYLIGLFRKFFLGPIKEYPLISSLTRYSHSESDLIPPEDQIYVGGGDYLVVGEHFFRLFVKLGGLKPADKVLDVGCGSGRMAIPLTRYLRRGSYEGFDIVPAGINWCNKHFTTRYPNFHFRHADVYNKQYNLTGTCQASAFTFPFKEDYFDFVFLTSVFTHMFPKDMEHYFAEISRVMKPGGRCLITYFLLNSESLSLLERGLAIPAFEHQMDGFRTSDVNIPEAAIAFDESYITKLYKQFGLDIIQPIHFGNWCKRQRYLSYQDVIVAQKKRRAGAVLVTSDVNPLQWPNGMRQVEDGVGQKGLEKAAGNDAKTAHVVH
jgi:ubiquinone/menaquinone biosynthesis C-methylase UbiE